MRPIAYAAVLAVCLTGCSQRGPVPQNLPYIMDGTLSAAPSASARVARRSAFASTRSDITASADRDAAFEAKLAQHPKNSREYMLLLREKDYEEFRAESKKWVICKGC
jgi:hypothetical protein